MSLRLAHAGPWRSETVFKPSFSFSGAHRAPLPFLCLISSLWDLKLPVSLLACLCISLACKYLPCSSVTTLFLHLSRIFPVSRYPFRAAEPSLLYLQWPGCPADCLGVENWGLLTGGQPHWTAMRLPNSFPESATKCLLAAVERKPNSQWGTRQQKIWFPRPQVILLRHKVPLFIAVFHGMLTIFSNFLG